MGAFRSAVITKKGHALLAKVLYGSTKLEFTQIKTSEKALSGDLTSLTDIGTVKQAEKIASVVRQNEYNVKVSASFSNEGLTAGYYVRNIGLYAMDPTEGEILYSISVADESTATADWMPPFNSVSVSSLMVALITAVSNASKVSIVVDPTATATVAQIVEVNERVTALANTITTTTEKTLIGSVAGGLKINKICGKSVQNTTAGKNLVPSIPKTEVVQGVTFTLNADGTILVNGTATAYASVSGEIVDIKDLGGNPVALLGTGKGTNVVTQLRTFNANGEPLGNITCNDMSYAQNTLSSEVAKVQFECYVATGKTASNVRVYPYLAMYEGVPVSAEDYEPYTGGISSPNPDYPQGIRSVEVSELKVHKKNLLIYASLPHVMSNYGSVIEQARFRVTKGKTYTVSAYIEADEDTSAYWNGLSGAFYNETINLKQGRFKYSKTFVALKDIDNTRGEKNLILLSKSATGDNVAIIAEEVQIEEGSVATAYEPYTENSITLSQPITLNGIGDVSDAIVMRDGVYGIEQRVVKQVFMGIEDLETPTSDPTYITYAYSIITPNTSALTITGALCTRFKEKTPNQLLESSDIGFAIGDSSGRIRFRFGEAITNIETAKAKMRSWYDAGNPLIVYGKFHLGSNDVPPFEPLPIEDQIALRSLLSYDTITHLNTNSEIDPVIEVEYGTNKIGAHTLTGLLTAQRNELKLAELTSAVLTLNQE